MHNFVDSKKGRTLSKIVKNRGDKLIRNLKKHISKDIARIANEEVNNTSNWSISSDLVKTDPDLFRVPKNDKYAQTSLSVKDAIEKDSSSPYIKISKDNADISIGNIQQLLRLSPRILYFEFGTMGKSEVRETAGLSSGISDFDIWNNPYIEKSKLKSLDKFESWGFLSKEGGGRFGKGYMIPASSNKVEPFKGISPVRMYRGSMPVIEKRIRGSLKDMIGIIKGDM